MRPELYEPQNRAAVEDTLALVGVIIRDSDLQRWTKFELILAYDWARRELLVASDHLIRRRPKPSFVTDAHQRSVRARSMQGMPREAGPLAGAVEPVAQFLKEVMET